MCASSRLIALCIPNCKSLWIKASAKRLNVNVNVNLINALWQQLQPQVFFGYDASSFAHLHYFLSPFFSLDHLKLCQVGWGPSVDSHV